MRFVPLVGLDWDRKAKYPSVVLESEWSESGATLVRDARLWQVGSERAVRIVLLAKFFKPDTDNKIAVRLTIDRSFPDADTTPTKEYVRLTYLQTSTIIPILLICQFNLQQIFPAPINTEENLYIKLKEFYAGDCPPGIEPETRVHLDLERLRAIARIDILNRGNLPA